MSDNDKRLMLREKVESSLARIKDRDPGNSELALRALTSDDASEAKPEARDAPDNTAPMGFAQKHPFALMGGALVLGLVIGSRTKRAKPSAGKRARKSHPVLKLLAEAAAVQSIKMVKQTLKSRAN